MNELASLVSSPSLLPDTAPHCTEARRGEAVSNAFTDQIVANAVCGRCTLVDAQFPRLKEIGGDDGWDGGWQGTGGGTLLRDCSLFYFQCKSISVSIFA